MASPRTTSPGRWSRTARAVRSVTLFPAAAGEVSAVYFAPNRKVKKGDVLLELDNRNEALAVELAWVRVQNARQLLSRYEQTAGSGAVAESTVFDARSAFAEAEIAQRSAAVALSDRSVVAPFDGFVGQTEIDVGDRIGTADAITTLDDRSFVARAHITNDGDGFRPGMSFAVTLDVLGARYPLVPEIAVRYGLDGAFAWVVRGDVAARVPLRIVQRQDATVLVDAALKDGEIVVVEGIQRLRPGIKVTLAQPPS